MKTTAISILVLMLGGVPAVPALDYEKDIVPLLKERCFECHSNEKGKTKGNLVLDDIEEMRDYQIAKFSLIRPGNVEESQFVDLMKLPAGDSDAMPPKGERMPAKDIKVIEQWIMEGATIDGVTRNIDGEEIEMGESAAAKSEDKEAEAETATDFLKWTNAEGREIEARFMKLDGEKVVLLMRDGKSYPYPLAMLSQESQAQARKLGAEAAADEAEAN